MSAQIQGWQSCDCDICGREWYRLGDTLYCDECSHNQEDRSYEQWIKGLEEQAGIAKKNS